MNWIGSWVEVPVWMLLAMFSGYAAILIRLMFRAVHSRFFDDQMTPTKALRILIRTERKRA